MNWIAEHYHIPVERQCTRDQNVVSNNQNCEITRI